MAATTSTFHNLFQQKHTKNYWSVAKQQNLKNYATISCEKLQQFDFFISRPLNRIWPHQFLI